MVRNILNKYYSCLINNKKFILLYILFICFFIVAMFTPENYKNPTFEIGAIVFIVIIGSFLILYAFRNKNNIHNVAFVTILFFGLLMVIFTPPFVFPDEGVHFLRPEYITEGILLPKASSSGYLVQDYFFVFNTNGFGTTFIKDPSFFNPITDSMGYWPTTTQTPFYAHIFSAIGIFIAKLFDLTAIGALWLARLGNLIFYALIARFAIKKVTTYKIPLFLMACIPLLISQVSSVSYDAFILTLGLLMVAYFIYMYTNKVENKDLLIFFICCLLISIIKPIYLILLFLVFFIPSKNFKSKNYKFSMIIPVVIIIILCILFTIGVIPGLGNSAVNISPNSNHNPIKQLNFLLSNPLNLLNFFVFCTKSFIGLAITDLSYFHFADYKGIKFFNLLYFIFFFAFSILYPIKIKLPRIKRIFLIFGFIVFYYSMFFVIYLSWVNIGADPYLLAQPRYFVPLMPLIPLAINYPFKTIKNIDSYVITFIIIFLAGLFLLPITHYY